MNVFFLAGGSQGNNFVLLYNFVLLVYLFLSRAQPFCSGAPSREEMNHQCIAVGTKTNITATAC